MLQGSIVDLSGAYQGTQQKLGVIYSAAQLEKMREIRNLAFAEFRMAFNNFYKVRLLVSVVSSNNVMRQFAAVEDAGISLIKQSLRDSNEEPADLAQLRTAMMAFWPAIREELEQP